MRVIRLEDLLFVKFKQEIHTVINNVLYFGRKRPAHYRATQSNNKHYCARVNPDLRREVRHQVRFYQLPFGMFKYQFHYA